jgi:hypothetical protein
VEDGAWLEEESHWGHVLGSYSSPWPLPVRLILLPGGHELNTSLPCPPTTMMFCLAIVSELAQPRSAETPKAVICKSFLTLSCLGGTFGHSNERS